ncbi:MAG TPA: hypothetical protein VFY90_02220 [Tepidiformaceae bacterium]|nr:hypothetical protein [Tepidiformaceae bacterium]
MPRPPSRRRHQKPAPRRIPLLLIGGAVIAVAFTAVVLAAVLGGGGKASPSSSVDVPIPAPATSGVEVAQPSVDLGRVPLNQLVNHSFVLKNTNDRAVELGVPAIEVLDGC